MHRPHVVSAVVMSLLLCACDARRDFSGASELSGELSLSEGRAVRIVKVKSARLAIIADAFDSDSLYLDFDCGLSATMQKESFELDVKKCPSYIEDSCSLTWTFSNGLGTLKDDSSLDFDTTGTVDVKCTDGTSGLVNFSFQLTGVRGDGSTSGPSLPGEQSGDARSSHLSAVRAAVIQSVRSQLP